MSTLVDSVPIEEESFSSVVHLFSDINGRVKNERPYKHVLKSRENIFKPKCNKTLKRKLKKYKLRKDGQEDEDVLNVSQILVASLKIKSPNNNKDNLPNNIDLEEIRPRNYLFKMVRRNQNSKKTKKSEVETAIVDEVPQDVPTPSNDQDKKQTNAFKLMMDSRNRSIGGNSPGKEKPLEENDSLEVVEKKNLKVKRNLVLQKMAEAKGSLQRKEKEEFQDMLIKRKMDKRAERLKKMMKNDGSKLVKPDEGKNNLDTKKAVTTPAPSDNDKTVSNKNQQKTLQLINIFKSPIKSLHNVSPEKKNIPAEDIEFLKKLSPSLKKKENMLCYFKKVEKESESIFIDNDNGNAGDNDHIIFKVKLKSKIKKKTKKKKLSLIKNDACNEPEVNEDVNKGEAEISVNSSDNLPNNTDHESRKRKRKENIIKNLTTDKEDSNVVETKEISDGRPKRNVKRPIKYVDDVHLTSSDEELHIFTPKKKKHSEAKCNSEIASEVKVDKKEIGPIKSKKEVKNNVLTPQKKMVKEGNQVKKATKLAPIFAVKPQLTQAEIEARQKFLHSGVPDQLKKCTVQKKNQSTCSSDFPVVVHIQQSEIVKNVAPHRLLLDLLHIDEVFDEGIKDEELFKSLLATNVIENGNNVIPSLKFDTQTLLQNIKQQYPKFPVYRTYHLLRNKSKGEFVKDFNYSLLDNSIEVLNNVIEISNDNPDKLSWTEKYRATSANQIIGNFESIKELKRWLVTWTENAAKTKNVAASSDSSDFYESDTDSRDSMRTTNNLLIITGPVGSGKTASVYAVAAELAIKVIEVNASSKRTGKIMLQDLQEATQSHKVNRGKGSADNSQKSQEIIDCDAPKKVNKRGRPKKSEGLVKKDMSAKKSFSVEKKDASSEPSSQESTRTGMSLILIDDADIVFEQDDGFCSAISQLVQSSKRPVILVTASLSCPHLQKFLQCAKVMTMNRLLPRMLGTWLDILCLADNRVCWPGLGAKFLDYFKGDIRKTINYLQFFMCSYNQSSTPEEDLNSQNSDYKANIDDENSNMSWTDREAMDERNVTDVIVHSDDSVWKCYMGKNLHLLHFKYPMNLFNLWWSVPTLLKDSMKCKKEDELRTDKLEKNNKVINELEAMCNVVDSFSRADYFSHMKLDTKSNITSQPWYTSETDSVSENDHIDVFNRNHEVGDEISHVLISRTIVEAQRCLGCENETNVFYPGMAVQRQRDKVISRHHNLSKYLNPSAVLDRRSLALDYWSTCRNICRLEKAKTDNNSKRHNRFCHYLKSANILCKPDTFDNIGESLTYREN